MKRLICFLGIILLFTSLTSAQKTRTFEMEIEKPKDDVWDATILALMEMKYLVKESNKEDGFIFSQRRTTGLGRLADVDASDTETIQILIREEDGKTKLTLSWNWGQGSNIFRTPKQQSKKVFNKFSKLLNKKLFEDDKGIS